MLTTSKVDADDKSTNMVNKIVVSWIKTKDELTLEKMETK